MSKPYNYEELWDSFSASERRSILESIWNGRQRFNEEQVYARWGVLPPPVQDDLRDVDWEFALGRRFAPQPQLGQAQYRG
jgi:hypothetical protein